MKRFCEDCKYFYGTDLDGYSIYKNCRAFPNRMFSALRPYYNLPECDDINSTNECDAFELKPIWHEQLKRKIIRMVEKCLV